MKNSSLISLAALVLLTATGCDRHSPDVAKKIAELEQKNQEAVDRQRELEQELEDQKLAAERDAIERERVRIAEDRAELERQQGAAAAEQDQALRERENALSNREGKLEQFQSALEEKEGDLHERTQQLSERDRELAGREALSVEPPAPSEPVADYGMFYDSLSSYGSWFETPDYGYVWQPVVVSDSNWRPYSRGRWACSDRGWLWVSEEPFGWATYHYGRWTLLRDRGWIWVPGAEWAPCWVSWRENDSHIGWAPLPPETLAYRGHNWDSSVDVQFGIGARCYNFVEMRYFGGSLYNHCLPVSGNGGYFLQTSNITYIHIDNRQVICGGPKYNKVSKGAGRPLPFYRLEIDQHPRPSRDALGMRPRIKGDRIVVSAPNMDVAWNDGLKPKRIKERIETVTVERDGNLGREITDRYRQTREDGRRKAEASIVEQGGAEQFDQRRDEKLQDNRRVAEGKGRKELTREVVKNPERPQRNVPDSPESERKVRPADPVPDRIVRQPNENRPRPEIVDDRRNPVVKDTLRVAPGEAVKPKPEPRPQRPLDDRRVAEATKQMETSREPQRQTEPTASARKEAAERRQQEQAREAQRQAKQTEADQARQAQMDAIRRKQDEQTQQKQLEKQREAEQARNAQKESVRQQQREQERAQRQQQEIAQQREQERAQRQQQEDQQRDMQRQQERAQQRQQEESRQRQQEDNQRQQDHARQRQQEENQRQRQQEDSRQKQEKDQKDQDDQRKRNR